jgi:RNA polymerase sigma factor for flagellar operon FliA
MQNSTALKSKGTSTVKPEAGNLSSRRSRVDGNQAEKLAEYSPLVKIIVARMRSKLPSHADLEELESAGMMGLLAAIERYDPSRGYTFQTYASVRIRGAILDELRAMDMVPRSVRLKQRLLARTSAYLEQRNGRAPTDAEIRAELNLEPAEFEKLRSQTKPVSIIYLDGPAESESDNQHDLIADDTVEFASDRMEKEELMELVARKIMELPDQQRKVLALYFNEGMRLAEIGELMGLSEARICQIRGQALEHLRRFVSRLSDQ